MSDFATVAVDGYTVTSTSESAEGMIASLTPPKEDDGTPVEVKPEGDEPAETEPEKTEEQKAASVLGKKGAEALAAKRAAEAEEKAKAEKEAKKGNPRHDPQARVAEATREAREAKEEAARERKERERLADELARERAAKAKPVQPEQPSTDRVQAAKVDDDPEPQEADFENYKDYVKAAARWAARDEHRQAAKIAAERNQASARDQQVSRAIETFFSRISTRAIEDAEFQGRTGAFVGSLQPTPMLAPNTQPTGFNFLSDEIVTSESAALLADYFAKEQTDLQRIAALRTRRDVTREVAKIEARLEARSEAATAGTSSRPEVSKAKPPVRPVTGSPHTANAEPDPDASSYDEHARYYNAKERRR